MANMISQKIQKNSGMRMRMLVVMTVGSARNRRTIGAMAMMVLVVEVTPMVVVMVVVTM